MAVNSIPEDAIAHTAIQTAFIDDDIVQCPLLSATVTCGACFGIPRYPFMLPCCAHILCCQCCNYMCTAQIEQLGEHLPQRNGKIGFSCPKCRKLFALENSKGYPDWHPWMKLNYNSIRVRCCHAPCTFIDGPATVVWHELEKCKYRPILCSNDSCGDILPYNVMVVEHLPTCVGFFGALEYIRLLFD